MVSGSKYPTSSCYFHQIWEVKKPDGNIALMVGKMKEKHQKYWDLSYMQICILVILDSRFKFGFIKFRLHQGFGDKSFLYFSKVEKTFWKLFDEYSLQFGDLTPENALRVNEELDFDDPWADWGKQQNAQQRRRVSDLHRYLEEKMVSVGGDLDILQY